MFLSSYCKRAVVLTMSVAILIGCTSTKTKEEESDRDRIIKTAKINSQLGIAYLEKGNTQRAKQKLLIALSQAPQIPEPWYSMGYYLEATGDKTEAKTYYLKALSVAPTRGDAQNNYGTFLCRSGQHEESIQHFILATRDVDYLDVGSAYENAGLCAMKIPDNKMAAHYFELALKQDPMRQLSLYKLAEVNYAMGNYKKAKTTLNELTQIIPPTTETIALSTKIEKRLAPSSVPTVNPILAENKSVKVDQPIENTPKIEKVNVAVVKPINSAKAPVVKPTNSIKAAVVKPTTTIKTALVKPTNGIKAVAAKSAHPIKPVALSVPKKLKPIVHMKQLSVKKPANKLVALHAKKENIA